MNVVSSFLIFYLFFVFFSLIIKQGPTTILPWSNSPTSANLSVQWELPPYVYVSCNYRYTFSHTPSFSQSPHIHTSCKRAGIHSNSWIQVHPGLLEEGPGVRALIRKLPEESLNFISVVLFRCLSNCRRDYVFSFVVCLHCSLQWENEVCTFWTNDNQPLTQKMDR